MSELYTRYIKISRLDKDGNDISPTLSNLTSITIPWEDGSIAQYNVLGSTSTSEYYNFVVEYESTSSIDFTDSNIKEEISLPFSSSLSGIMGTSFIAVGTFVGGIGVVSDPSSVIPRGSYHIRTPDRYKFYKIRTYLQQDLTLRISGSMDVISGTSTTPSPFISFIKSSNDQPIFINPLTGFSQFTSGASFIGDKYFFPTGSIPGIVPIDFTTTIPSSSLLPGDFITLGGLSLSVMEFAIYTFESGSEFSVSASYLEPSGSEITLEPPFTEIFTDSDCDVLQGNVIISRPNNQLQDMDFSTSQIKPVNYEALVNYTATKATYPLSSFTQTSILSPEYSSVNTVPTFNSGSGFNAQSSISTNVIYFDNYIGPDYPGVGPSGRTWENEIYPKYVITPEEEIIDVSANDDISRGTLEQTIASFANIPPFAGTPNGFANIKGGVFTDQGFIEASFNGGVAVFTQTSNTASFTFIRAITNITGSNPLPLPQNIGGFTEGVLYPGGIENTRAADLPSKVVKILKEKNLI